MAMQKSLRWTCPSVHCGLVRNRFKFQWGGNSPKRKGAGALGVVRLTFIVVVFKGFHH